MRGPSYDKLLLLIACVITIIWGIGVIVQSIFPDHPAPDGVNQVMIIVAGGLFGGSVIANIKRNGRGDDE